MKQSVNIPNAPAPIGPYSPAIIAGNQLFVSGQILENLKHLVEAAGFHMNDLVKCSIFLKDLANFTAVNEIYSRYFEETPPARETVEISRLPMDAIIEISCIAIKA